jgi:hypothetical protein
MDHNSTAEKKQVAPEPNSVDLTLRYYQLLKQDQLLHISGFKNRVRNAQIIGTAVAGLLAFLLGSPASSLNLDNLPLWFWGTFGVMTVTYFLIHDVLESVFAVKALDEYLSYLEERAEDLGIKGLFWQSVVAKKLWSASHSRIGFPAPERCVGAYAAILIAGITIFLPGYVCYEVWRVSEHQRGMAAAILAVLLLYSIVSTAVMIRVSWGLNDPLRNRVRSLIDEKSRGEIAGTLNNADSRVKYK